jgi:hypothetical protein
MYCGEGIEVRVRCGLSVVDLALNVAHWLSLLFGDFAIIK